MAKININFNATNYSIDEANLAPATDALKAHLETLKGGGLAEGGTYTFKNYIPDEEINAWLEKATDIAEGAGLFAIYATEDYSNMATVNSPMVMGGSRFGNHIDVALGDGTNAIYLTQAFRNGVLQSTNVVVEEDVENWAIFTPAISGSPSTFSKCDPPTITIPSSALKSVPFEESSLFFDLGGGSGNEGYTKIVINGVDYFVDSTKLEPATNSLIAHLETLKGGEGSGNGLAFGKKVKFKDIITKADVEAYVANATPFEENLYMVSFPWMMLIVPEANTYMLFDETTGEAFGTNLSALGYDAPDNTWTNLKTNETATEAPVITITENAEPPMSADLATTAVFFDIPSAGGTLAFGTNWKFKDVITVEDFEAVISHYGPMPKIQLDLEDKSHISMIKMDIDDQMGETGYGIIYSLGYKPCDAEEVGCMNIDLLTEAGAQALESALGISDFKAGWRTQAGEALDSAPTIPNVSADALVGDAVGDNQTQTSLNPAYVASLFEVPGNGGDTKIVINGAEDWVDSAKLADAKSALAAHLKALEDAVEPDVPEPV